MQCLRQTHICATVLRRIALAFVLPIAVLLVAPNPGAAEKPTADEVKIVREAFSISPSISDADLTKFLQSEYKDGKTHFDTIRGPLALYRLGSGIPRSGQLTGELNRSVIRDVTETALELTLASLVEAAAKFGGYAYSGIAYTTVQAIQAIVQAAGGIWEIMRAEENQIAAYYIDQMIASCGRNCTEKQSLAAWNTTLHDLDGLPVVENIKTGKRNRQRVYAYSQLAYQGRRMFQYPESRQQISDSLNRGLAATALIRRDLSPSSASKEQLSEERPVTLTVQDAPVVPGFRVYIPLFLSVGASTGTTIAREGDTVRMGIPSNSAVEFFFEADRATVPPGATATWYVNNKPFGSSLGSQVFSAGQHRVELAITRPPDTAMSTPATTFATERAGVTLDLIEHSQHACPGRLGRSCSGSLPGEDRIINPVTHVGHYQMFGRIRVASEVSVGAIRHDACCAQQARAGKVGHMCSHPQLPSPTARSCVWEWREAIDDWRHGFTWLGEWVYQGERLVSSRTLAPPGALLRDKPGNAKYCESGRAESSGRDGIIRCSGQIPIPPWAEDSRTPSPDGLHIVRWTKAEGTSVTSIQTGRTTRVPFERFPQKILTPHVEGQWWFSYWDAVFKWADNGRRFAFTRCSVDWDKPPCAVFLYDLDLGGSPEMVAEDLVIGAYHGPGPLGFADKKLIFRGSGEVSTIYEYDPKNRGYRPLVNAAVGGAELSPDRNRIAYFTADDLLVFHLGTATSSVVVQKVSSLSGMSEEARLWTVAWRSPQQLEFMNVNDSGRTRREVDVTGTNLRRKR